MGATFYMIWLFAATGLIFIALGLPLKNGRVKPNIWYGFRTRKTLSNDDIWYTVNRVTGADMIYGGSAILAACAVLAAVGNWLPVDAVTAILLAVTLGATAWMVFSGLAQLRKL